MSTLFNLVGTFQHETRARPGALVRVSEHKITLAAGLRPDSVCTPAATERLADIQAVKHSKHTPWERMWMTDWQLVEIHQQEKVA